MDEGLDATGEIQFVVHDFRELDEVVFSDTVKVKNIPWRLMVFMKDSSNSSQTNKGKSLGVYLRCVPESLESQEWSMSVQATITLVNQVDSNKCYSKDFTHCFCVDSLDWGYSSFLKWKDVVDPGKGYLWQNNIIVTAQIHVLSFKIQPSKGLSALACPACLKAYACTGQMQPRSLKCGHTFCGECLHKLCSHKEGGLVHLTCSLCSQEHTDSSESQLWFPNHSVIQMIDNVILKSKHFCDTHQHDKTFYCLDDHMLVCIYCAYQGEHLNHKCEPINKARQQVEPLVSLFGSEASSQTAKLERQLQLLKDEKKIVKSQERNVVDVMENFFTSIESALRNQKEQLLLEVNAHVSKVESALDVHIKRLESETVKARETMKEYGSWQKLPARDALDRVSALKFQLKSISAESDDVPTIVPKLSFEMPCSNVLTSIGHLGQLHFTKGEDSETSLEIPPLKRKKTNL